MFSTRRLLVIFPSHDDTNSSTSLLPCTRSHADDDAARPEIFSRGFCFSSTTFSDLIPITSTIFSSSPSPPQTSLSNINTRYEYFHIIFMNYRFVVIVIIIFSKRTTQHGNALVFSTVFRPFENPESHTVRKHVRISVQYGDYYPRVVFTFPVRFVFSTRNYTFACYPTVLIV